MNSELIAALPRFLDVLGLDEEPMGIYYTDERPAKGFSPKPMDLPTREKEMKNEIDWQTIFGQFSCVIGNIWRARKKKSAAYFDAERFGCAGGAFWLGFMKPLMKSLLYCVLFSMILNQTVMADDKKVAEELLKSKLNAVISVLEKKELKEQTKKKKIVEIVTPIFDFSLMARLTLGKKYWPGLSTEKKERFTELLVKRLKESYSDKIFLYTDEKIHFETPIQVRKKMHVPTVLISKNNKISILYKFYNSKNSWRVYDIEVQGVSLISTYRSQFDEVLRTGTIDDLLLKLEKPKNK